MNFDFQNQHKVLSQTVTNKPRTKKNRTKKKQPTAHFTHLFFANAKVPTQKNKRVKSFQRSE